VVGGGVFVGKSPRSRRPDAALPVDNQSSLTLPHPVPGTVTAILVRADPTVSIVSASGEVGIC
jgi:hypothetical protein